MKYVSGTQWLIDSFYPNYKDLFVLTQDLDETKEYSKETVAVNAKQYPLWCEPKLSQTFYHRQFSGNFKPHNEWHNIQKKLFEWTKKILAEHELDLNIQPTIAWYMDYQENGWQSMHNHDSDCVTQVIYLDNLYHYNLQDPPKESAWGSIFAVLAGGEEAIYKTLMPKEGRCILMTGNVLHGVYPVKSTPRRCIVVDYKIKR